MKTVFNRFVHRPRRGVRKSALGLVVLALTFSMAACAGTSDTAGSGYTGVVREDPLQVGSVSLQDVTYAENRAEGVVENGELQMKAAPGRLLLVYFGFTNCPDVCPTTLADLRVGLRDLPESERDRVDVAFVTVDPERDTEDILNRYTVHFFNRFHVVRDESARITAAASAFLASFKVEKTDGATKVSHTAVLYAVDDTGTVRVEWPFGTPGPQMGEDIARLFASLEVTDASS